MLSNKALRLFAALLAAGYLRVLMMTLRVEYIGQSHLDQALKSHPHVVFAAWHGRLLLLPLMVRQRPLHALISHHRDGILISKIAGFFGIKTVAGSSRRGAVSGLKGLIRAGKNSHLFITPDGPKGPCYQAKSGVLDVAKITKKPIIPVSFYAEKSKVFASWDHFMFPKPFSRVVIAYGPAFFSDTPLSEAEQRLSTTQQQAEQRLA